MLPDACRDSERILRTGAINTACRCLIQCSGSQTGWRRREIGLYYKPKCWRRQKQNKKKALEQNESAGKADFSLSLSFPRCTSDFVLSSLLALGLDGQSLDKKMTTPVTEMWAEEKKMLFFFNTAREERGNARSSPSPYPTHLPLPIPLISPSLSPSLSLPHTQLSTGSLMASHDSITDCICLDLGVVLKEPAVHEGLGSVCVC